MSIRSKLLLLLLAIALVPMALLSRFLLSGSEELAQGLTEQTRGGLIARERSYLGEKVSDTARLLHKHFAVLEYAIDEQARQVERVLAELDSGEPVAGRPHTENPLALARDYDAGNIPTRSHPLYTRMDSEGSTHPLPISFERIANFVFGAARNAVDLNQARGLGELREAAVRLQELLPTYAKLQGIDSAETIWHYTSLDAGLHSVYPGHGGYPADYDPRLRGWYRAAAEAGGPVWSTPFVDVSTGRVINTISRAVHHPDGSFAGVTAIDISTPDIFHVVSTGPTQWGADVEAMIVAPIEEAGLQVYARASKKGTGQPWDQTFERELLVDTNHALHTAMAELIEHGQVGFATAEYRGEQSLWAFSRLRSDAERGSLIAMAVPMAEVLGRADAAAASIAERIDRQERLMLAALMLAALLVASVAILTSYTVTKPLERLSQTAVRITAGNYQARVELDRKDEIGALGRAVDQMAESIETLLRQQEEACLQMLKSLTKALQSKDAYTAAHSGRVSHYSRLLGEQIGLDQTTLNVLTRGALVHDLGKIGVPELVLNKPAALTDEEYETIKRHPVDSAIIMRPLVRLKAYSDIAAWHHEHWDGSGYPDGLKGEEIPLLARIVSIADTWDAMTGARSYHKGMPVEKGLEILEREKDSGQWDPTLVRAFIEVVRQEYKSGAMPEGKAPIKVTADP